MHIYIYIYIYIYIFDTSNDNSAFEMFYEQFNLIYNECIPSVIKRVRGYFY